MLCRGAMHIHRIIACQGSEYVRMSFFPQTTPEPVDRGHERSSYRCAEKGKHA